MLQKHDKHIAVTPFPKLIREKAQINGVNIPYMKLICIPYNETSPKLSTALLH